MLTWLVWTALWLGILAVTESSCPTTRCSCEFNTQNQRVINCRTKNLDAVPTWEAGSDQFYELTLARNRITSLPSGGFQGLNIQVLDLSDNVITDISPNAFTGLESNLQQLILHVRQLNSFPMEQLSVLTSLKILHLEGFKVPSWMSDVLPSLPQLEKLYVVNCGVSFIHAPVLGNVLGTLEELSLSNNALTTMPTEVFQSMSNLHKLNLGHNSIEVIEANTFQGLSGLEELDFSNNGLQTVKPDAFRGLEESLEKLVLSVNHLTEHQILPIGSLTSLTRLHLSYNQLTRIPNNVFASLSNLDHLDLHGNKLASLDRSSFSGLQTSLQVLILAENELASVGSGTFQNLPVLRDLYLDQQPVGSLLQENTFLGLENTLRLLSLQNIGFTSSNWDSVLGLESLQTLKLKSNVIDSLPENAFKQLSQLKTLDLSDNQLSSITPQQFNGLQHSLKSISLSKNSFSNLGHCVFFGFTSLEELSLSDVPLHCDCELRWLRQWMDDNMDEFDLMLNDWKCNSGPGNVAGEYLRDLSVNDFTCNVDTIPDQCPDLTLTTTAPPVVPSESPSVPSPIPSLEPLLLNITGITDTSCVVSWQLADVSYITGFIVEHREIDGEDYIGKEELPSNFRQTEITHLSPSMDYVVCVTFLLQKDNRATDETSCASITTGATSAPIVEPQSNVSTIVGAVLGAIACLIVLAVVVFLVLRYKRKAEDPYHKPKGFGSPGEAVARTGYNSKRYSRPKTSSTNVDNESNKDLEKKLEGFTAEERDRILNILTTSGGSTWSNASSRQSLSPRYVPELPPRPSHLEGYLNPQQILDEDPDKHIYQEIGDLNANKECYI